MSTNVIPAKFRKIQPVKGVNQASSTYFQTTPPVEKKKNVRLLPNLFSGLLKQYRAKQHEIKQKKIDFLTSEAYKYFYDLLETPKVADVDLPEFLYEKQRRQLAYDYAHKALVDVIADGRLNECYTKRMKEIKNRG